MDQQEKLTKFEKAVFSEIDEQVEALRRDAEESLQNKLQKNKEAQLQRSVEAVQRLSQEIQRHSKRDIAKYGLEVKRTILHKRNELTQRVFDDVTKRLRAFHSSSEYAPYLLKRITSFAKEHSLSNVEIMVGEQDMSLADQIKKAYALPCEVASDPTILMGGFIIRAQNDNTFYDETISQRLAEQRTYFIENSELYL